MIQLSCIQLTEDVLIPSLEEEVKSLSDVCSSPDIL